MSKIVKFLTRSLGWNDNYVLHIFASKHTYATYAIITFTFQSMQWGRFVK